MLCRGIKKKPPFLAIRGSMLEVRRTSLGYEGLTEDMREEVSYRDLPASKEILQRQSFIVNVNIYRITQGRYSSLFHVVNVYV